MATRACRQAPVARSLTTAWHLLPAADVARRVETRLDQWLSRAEAAGRLLRHGANALGDVRGRSALAIVLAQFRSLIVALLLVVAAVAVALGDNVEAGAILVVIVLNALIGFFTEWKAHRTLAALRRQMSSIAPSCSASAGSTSPAAATPRQASSW